MFINLRERKGGEREGEKHRCGRNIDQLLPVYTPTRDWNCDLGMYPDWESNPQPCGVWDDISINWVTGQGLITFLIQISR